MEKKIVGGLVGLSVLTVLFLGCISNEDIQKNELIPVSDKEITILGRLYHPSYAWPPYGSEAYPDYSTGGLDFYLDYPETKEYDLQKVVLSAYIRDVNWSDYRHLYATKIEMNKWYEVTLKDKILEVVITNPLNVDLNDLVIESYKLGVKRIDRILPGESKKVGWVLSDCKEMQSTICIEIKSGSLLNSSKPVYDSIGGVFVLASEEIHVSPKDCPIPAEIGIIRKAEIYKDKASKKPVIVGDDFNAYVVIKNYGDLIARDVRCELRLPPELTTSDNSVKHINILPHLEKKVDWTITAKKGGTSAFEVIASLGNDSSAAVIFVPVAMDDHDIELVMDKSLLGEDDILYINESDTRFKVFRINLTIINSGDLVDEVNFQYLVTNKEVNFRIYDGDERVISQPVTVPSNGNKTVSLEINRRTHGSIPDSTEIVIHATSKFDPTASDKVTFKVRPGSG